MDDLERIDDMLDAIQCAMNNLANNYELMSDTEVCRGYLESAQSKLETAMEDLYIAYEYSES